VLERVRREVPRLDAHALVVERRDRLLDELAEPLVVDVLALPDAVVCALGPAAVAKTPLQFETESAGPYATSVLFGWRS